MATWMLDEPDKLSSVRGRTVSGAIALDLHASGERDIGLSSISGDVTVRPPEASDLEAMP